LRSAGVPAVPRALLALPRLRERALLGRAGVLTARLAGRLTPWLTRRLTRRLTPCLTRRLVTRLTAGTGVRRGRFGTRRRRREVRVAGAGLLDVLHRLGVVEVPRLRARGLR